MQPQSILFEYQQKKAAASAVVDLPQTQILYHTQKTKSRLSTSQRLGIACIAIAVGGLFAAAAPMLSAEIGYQIKAKTDPFFKLVRTTFAFGATNPNPSPEPATKPKLAYNPLQAPDGSLITPINTDFSIVIPKIGVNATVIPGVNPASKIGYNEALTKGVAHASTSFYPNENGTVYLFSHSTNYEWFVDDLNAVFYLVKNLEKGDVVVIMYLGTRYTYEITDKLIVSPREISYLAPIWGKRNLILQTCWPPGTISKRMLLFAELVDETNL